jgi:hypothetical protein
LAIAQLKTQHFDVIGLVDDQRSKLAGITLYSELPPREGSQVWLCPSGKPVGIKTLKPLGKGQWALTIKGASKDLLSQTSSLWEYPGFSFKTLEGYAFVLGSRWRDRKKAVNLEIPGYQGKWTATVFDEGKTLPGLVRIKAGQALPWIPGCPYLAEGHRLMPLTSGSRLPKVLEEDLRRRQLSINSLYTAEIRSRGWVTLPKDFATAPWREAWQVGPYRVLKTALEDWERRIAKMVKQPGGIHRKDAFEQLGIPRGLGESLLVRWIGKKKITERQFFLFPPDGGQQNLSPFARGILQEILDAGPGGLGGKAIRRAGWPEQLEILQRLELVLGLSESWYIAMEYFEQYEIKIKGLLEPGPLDVRDLKENLGLSRGSVFGLMNRLSKLGIVRSWAPKPGS